MTPNAAKVAARVEGLATAYLEDIGFPVERAPLLAARMHEAFNLGYDRGHRDACISYCKSIEEETER